VAAARAGEGDIAGAAIPMGESRIVASGVS